METIRGDWNRQREKSRELKVYYAATNFSKRAISSRALLCHLDSQQRGATFCEGLFAKGEQLFYCVLSCMCSEVPSQRPSLRC